MCYHNLFYGYLFKGISAKVTQLWLFWCFKITCYIKLSQKKVSPLSGRELNISIIIREMKINHSMHHVSIKKHDLIYGIISIPYIAELPYFFLNNLKIWWGKTIAFLHLADMMLKWGIHKRFILRRKCKDSNFMRLIKGYRSRCITMFLSFHLLQWILSPFFSSPLVLFSGSKATENRSERCPVSRSRSPWGVHLHLRDRCDRNRERWHLLLSLVI